MSRASNMSAPFLAALAARLSGVQAIMLCELSHADLDNPIRIAQSREDVTSNGDLFAAWDFSVAIPPDHEDKPYRTTITIDNVDHTFTNLARTASTEPEVALSIVTIETPDVVEATWPKLFLTDITYNEDRIMGTLSLEPLLGEPFPGHGMTPALFPGIF